MLPHDFPNYKTVNHYYNQWRREGRWDQILQALNQLYRQHQGRESTPSAGALDSQSVKTVALSGVHGYDGGKKLNGRKRHIVVDTLGLLMAIVVTSAKAGDGEVAPQVLEQVTPERYPRFLLLWADDDPEQGANHVGFKLSGSGEVLGLFDTDEKQNI